MALPVTELRQFLLEQLEANPVLKSKSSEGEQPVFSAEPVEAPTFRQFLNQQLHLALNSKRLVRIGEFLIGNLDDDGYLRQPLAELAGMIKARPATLERVLNMIQTLDPPGIGARNLRESLLLQLNRRGCRRKLVYRIVEKHWELLAGKKHRLISRKCRVPLEQVQAAVAELGRLNACPTAGYLTGGSAHQVVVDGIVVPEEPDFKVYLKEDYLLELAINPEYQALGKSKKLSAADRKFMQAKLKEAQVLLTALEERRQNLLAVFQAVVDYQKAFFLGGCLRPLREKDAASLTGLSVSTVSRIISSKYLQTPRGVMSLKDLFTGGLGPFLSRHHVKERIKEIINREKKSLSDRALSQLLRTEGITVAARTVNKYRRQMKILTSYLRK